MKVLFVCSGNSKFGISPIIKNQANSLTRIGVDIDFYTINGKGIKGYLSNIKPLRQCVRANNYDIIHAHYSLTAFVASLAGVKPLVVSLMGSDVKASNWYKFIIKLFSTIFSWKTIIVKSQDMYNDLSINSAKIIPNGVDIEKFKPLEKKLCQEQLAWDSNKKHILFPANPNRREKNFVLSKESVDMLDDKMIEIHYFNNTPNEETPIWYNAADLVLMTSLWEGSPNAIKEAMACNRPIVTTNVGDVRWIMGDTDGCYITSYDAKDCADKLKLALEFSNARNATLGLDHIIKLGLSSDTVAKTVTGIYNKILKM